MLDSPNYGSLDRFAFEPRRVEKPWGWELIWAHADAVRTLGFAYEGVGRTVSPLDVFPETSERDPETSE